jgi:hypothetical protein
MQHEPAENRAQWTVGIHHVKMAVCFIYALVRL